MKDILCKTCACNCSKFPVVLCKEEPFGESDPDTHHTECVWYVNKNISGVYIVVYYGEMWESKGNVIGKSYIKDAGHIAQPFKTHVAVIGDLTVKEREAFKDLYYDYICKDLLPVKNPIVQSDLAWGILNE